MSTSYYRLKPPITHLKLEEDELFDKLFIWVNYQLIGRLVLDKQDTCQILNCFALREPDNKCPLRSYWGGPVQGTFVYENERLPDETIVISGYGEIFTVAQVKTRQGAKRKNGLPTELFGYEGEK